MTSWQIGYAVGEPGVLLLLEQGGWPSDFKSTTVTQYTAIKALTGSQETVEIMRQAETSQCDIHYKLKLPGLRSLSLKERYLFYVKKLEMIYTDVTWHLQLFWKKLMSTDWHGLGAQKMSVSTILLIWKH